MDTGAEAETDVQWLASEFGARVGHQLMSASYYPVSEEQDSERVRTTVRLKKELHEDVEFVVQLWNEFDKALKRKGAKKWKANSVIERFVEVGVAGFWQQVGGRPESQQDREEFIRLAVERIKKQGAKK